MKKLMLFIVLLFVILTVLVCFCPIVTQWDRSVIMLIQDNLKELPAWIPSIFDCYLYASFIVLPLVFGIIYFCRKYLFIDVVLFTASPLIPFLFNHVFKGIIQRPRPPYELQLVHPGNYSYVSSHTLISFCLWGLVIYYLNRYCTNKFLKILGIFCSTIWILVIGFSRVWLGVHNPTDVIGAYLLGGIILIPYINIIKILGGKCQS